MSDNQINARTLYLITAGAVCNALDFEALYHNRPRHAAADLVGRAAGFPSTLVEGELVLDEEDRAHLDRFKDYLANTIRRQAAEWSKQAEKTPMQRQHDFAQAYAREAQALYPSALITAVCPANAAAYLIVSPKELGQEAADTRRRTAEAESADQDFSNLQVLFHPAIINWHRAPLLNGAAPSFAILDELDANADLLPPATDGTL